MAATSKLFLKENPTLEDLQQYVREMVIERGFNDTVATRFMLFFEETGEFAKAARKSAGMKLASDAARQDLAAEAADVLIVFLGICNMLGLDVEQAFRDKEEQNKRRTWK